MSGIFIDSGRAGGAPPKVYRFDVALARSDDRVSIDLHISRERERGINVARVVSKETRLWNI